MAVLFLLAKSQQVAGSNHNGVTGIFHWHNSGRTMTQALTEMISRIIFRRIKGTGGYGRQPYHLHVHIISKPGSLKLLNRSVPLQDCNLIALRFISFGNTVLTFSLSDWLRIIWCTSTWIDRYPADFRTEQLRSRVETRYCLRRRGRIHILRWREIE
jgi:hypothetical protein